MKDTGIDFLTELHNDDMDDQKMLELVEKIEKETGLYFPEQPKIADTPPLPVPPETPQVNMPLQQVGVNPNAQSFVPNTQEINVNNYHQNNRMYQQMPAPNFIFLHSNVTNYNNYK